MSCISSFSLSVLLNGERLNFFNPLEVLDKETFSLLISASSIWNT